jgi:hypothetical protein
MEITPATSILKTTWSNFMLGRHGNLPDAPPVFYGNVNISTVEYIGDADGNPRAVVQSPLGPGGYSMAPIQASEFLSETVTRADGSQATLLAILAETLDAAAPALLAQAQAAQAALPPAPPPPVP